MLVGGSKVRTLSEAGETVRTMHGMAGGRYTSFDKDAFGVGIVSSRLGSVIASVFDGGVQMWGTLVFHFSG